MKKSHDALLAQILALVVLGRWDALKKILRVSAEKKLPLESVREILLQAHLFAGFPRTIEAFETLSSVIASGAFDTSRKNGNSTVSAISGEALFEKIYASKSQDVLNRIAFHHPELKNWILEHAYGRVLSRPALSPKQRELASVAALVVSRQWKQLLSHLRGAIRCGASTEEITAVFRSIRPFCPAPTLAKARRIFQGA